MNSEQLSLAPSILSADPLCLGEEIESVEGLGADFHHIDVMDGHFVPNLSFGLPLIRAIKAKAKIPLDVHIMVSNPDCVALDYVQAGADILSFHFEAATHPYRIAQNIRENGALSGISINPGTQVEQIFSLLETVDVVLLMSVNPGFGGQSFIPSVLEKIKKLRSYAKAKGLSFIIEVDGGINLETAAEVFHAGCDRVVAGTAIYGAKDRARAIHAFKSLRRSSVNDEGKS